jgi:hypothetical protein
VNVTNFTCDALTVSDADRSDEDRIFHHDLCPTGIHPNESGPSGDTDPPQCTHARSPTAVPAGHEIVVHPAGDTLPEYAPRTVTGMFRHSSSRP